MMMVEEIVSELPFAPSDRAEKRVSFDKQVSYETVSTTDEESRSDVLSESTEVFTELRDEDSIDIDELSGLRTPDPLDFMPCAHIRPAFSEREVADTLAARLQTLAQQVLPSSGVQGGMTMPTMPPMGAKLPNGAVLVPMPLPLAAMPNMFPMPMPVAVPTAAPLQPHQVAVPKGFKLVRIPTANEPAPAVETKTASYSEIADPAKTDRKIFVGGLSPVTTEDGLVEYFSKFGPVADAKVVRDGEKSKGFAFVQFQNTTPAEVLEGMHIIDQRRCGVGLAFARTK
jgi:hypothetical protein